MRILSINSLRRCHERISVSRHAWFVLVKSLGFLGYTFSPIFAPFPRQAPQKERLVLISSQYSSQELPSCMRVLTSCPQLSFSYDSHDLPSPLNKPNTETQHHNLITATPTKMASPIYKNKLAIASVSLGMHASHTLPEKILAAAHNHFSGIEIVYCDLEAWCTSQSQPLLSGAQAIKNICKTHNLVILSLAPFKNFEAHTSPLSTRLSTARHWLELAQALGATYLQVPSQFDTENTIDDEDLSISELQALADLASEFGVKIAYEAVAWGTYVNTWQDSLRIVKRVDRVNFGMCWDAFHVLAKIWGSCTSPDGKLDAGDETLKKSLGELVEVLKGVDRERVFYVQLSDGERYEPVLGRGHRFWVEGMDERLIWSRNTRPFPLERGLGAYFPIRDVVRNILGMGGWDGWLSFEVFDWRMRNDSFLPEEAAKRGWKSWMELKKD
jgi:Xylose isomerase-like TIM barrel